MIILNLAKDGQLGRHQITRTASRLICQARPQNSLALGVASAFGYFESALASLHLGSGITATSWVSGVAVRQIKFAKQNAEAYFNLASELANAKDLTDVMGIQARHAQTSMQTYALQAQELGRLMMEASQSIGQK
jgi:hypothetical protein